MGLLNCLKKILIFFIYPDPEGSEKNQFTPHGAGVNKLIFEPGLSDNQHPVHLLVVFLFFFLLHNSCVSEFIPQISETKDLVVVEGLITDRPGINTVKLSRSMPLGLRSEAKPLSRCTVSIKDDNGNTYWLNETLPGTYVTDSSRFRGVAGRSYALEIVLLEGNRVIHYKSFPVEMKPVPLVDSLYYEKTIIAEKYENYNGIEGCQIYLDTRDPSGLCEYYRWEYFETWVLRLNFDVPNQTCWISNNSKNISIESTAALSEDRINRRPVTYISNVTDRLKTRYSILVNQYSMSKDEYNYWKKLRSLTFSVGGLHDIIPSSVQSNIICVEKPAEKVLGYFSVSAISSRRIYIKEKFEGIKDLYADCITDTIIGGPDYIEGMGISVWTLFDTPAIPFLSPRIRILTKTKGCADCTVRGTTAKPEFWRDDK